MRYLSQLDIAWAAKKLGASTLSIGRWGCTTTCISMLSDYFGSYESPLEIASHGDYYLKDGRILWNKLKFKNMRFVTREYGRHDDNIMKAISNPSKAVILEVNNNTHWVLPRRKALFGNDYVAVDPLSAKEINVISKYKNITGAAYFEGKFPGEPTEVIDYKFAEGLGKREYAFFIDVDNHGELWHVNRAGERTYLSPGTIMDWIEEHAEGIKESDLKKIPIKKL